MSRDTYDALQHLYSGASRIWQEVGGAKNCTIFDCAPNSNNWPDLLTKRYTELSGDGTALATIDTNFCA